MIKNSIALLLTTFLLNACTSSKPKPAKLYTVLIKDMKFVPDALYVNIGDTVKWINQDMVNHDVTEEVNQAWTSSAIPAGASWKWVVSDSLHYFCSLHVVMKGKIKVR